jgi:hypothetical protein
MSREPFDWVREKRNRRSNLLLIRRAVREGWSISEEQRQILVDAVFNLTDADDISTREFIGVARAMIDMDRANLRAALAKHREATRDGPV